MLFYRVEWPDGEGLYRKGAAGLGQELSDFERHPLPEEDPALVDYYDSAMGQGHAYFRFAFKSLDQLKYWIYRTEWRQYLHKQGLRVAVIEADGHYGDTQAMYEHNTRVDIEFLDLIEV